MINYSGTRDTFSFTCHFSGQQLSLYLFSDSHCKHYRRTGSCHRSHVISSTPRSSTNIFLKTTENTVI